MLVRILQYFQPSQSDPPLLRRSVPANEQGGVWHLLREIPRRQLSAVPLMRPPSPLKRHTT